jgi:hypothetical protein
MRTGEDLTWPMQFIQVEAESALVEDVVLSSDGRCGKCMPSWHVCCWCIKSPQPVNTVIILRIYQEQY